MSPTALLDAPAARPAPTSSPTPRSPSPAPPDDDLEAGPADGLLVSEQTYWTEYYLESDHHYEWNNGRLEEKPVSDFKTWLVYLWLLELIRHALRTDPVAQVVGLEMGFRLRLPGRTTIRKPDFGVVRDDNPNPLLPLDMSYHGIFDLCVEALSEKKPSGIERDLVVKKAEYAAAGVPEYFIVHREPERCAFFRLGPNGVYTPIPVEDGVIRSAVLPGLRFRPSDLIAQPGPLAMSKDPVYADFVLPEWGALERRAQEAAARADAEAQRADAEAAARQAAEQELAALRARLAAADQ